MAQSCFFLEGREMRVLQPAGAGRLIRMGFRNLKEEKEENGGLAGGAAAFKLSGG